MIAAGTDGGLLPIATRAAPRPKTGMLMNVTPSNPITHAPELTDAPEHRAVTGDRVDVRFTDAPGPGEHHYVVRAQSLADGLPAGPVVAYSSPTYVRSGPRGKGGT